MTEIPENPQRPRRRLLVRLVVVVAQALLLLAVGLLAALFLVLALWWKLTTWTVRQAPERHRSAIRRQAMLDLVRAAGTLVATRGEKPAA